MSFVGGLRHVVNNDKRSECGGRGGEEGGQSEVRHFCGLLLFVCARACVCVYDFESFGFPCLELTSLERARCDVVLSLS